MVNLSLCCFFFLTEPNKHAVSKFDCFSYYAVDMDPICSKTSSWMKNVNARFVKHECKLVQILCKKLFKFILKYTLFNFSWMLVDMCLFCI